MRTTQRPATRRPAGSAFSDTVLVEEPLEIRVEGEPLAVTMRTPGDDLDLAAGFLYTEGIIDGIDDLAALASVGDSHNVVDVRLAAGVAAHREALTRARRELVTTSACGLCGKQSIDRVHLHAPALPTRAEVRDDIVLALPHALRAAQPSFDLTGGSHGAALFDLAGRLGLCREDVGRHNAVDKVLGARLRAAAAPVDDAILLVSSRAGFEIVQKALVARVPVVVAIGAATQLAIDLAVQSNLVLIAFVRGGRFNRYA